jgi:hypothetical protein
LNIENQGKRKQTKEEKLEVGFKLRKNIKEGLQTTQALVDMGRR